MKNTRYNLKRKLLFFGIFILLGLFFSVVSALAAAKLESGIPGVGVKGAQGYFLPSVPTYINYLYIFILSAVGIAGFVSLVIWGTVWVGSAVVDKKAMAMEGIKNTLIGIGIALTAFIILYTINPDLTLIKTPETRTVDTANKARQLLQSKAPSTVLPSPDSPCAKDTTNPSLCFAKPGCNWIPAYNICTDMKN